VWVCEQLQDIACLHVIRTREAGMLAAGVGGTLVLVAPLKGWIGLCGNQMTQETGTGLRTGDGVVMCTWH
jgi:hypothetical protein